MILDEIVAHKRCEVRQLKSKRPLADLQRQVSHLPPPRPFRKALTRPERLSLIAELKKASPSRGILREDFNPGDIASIYARTGADALSVLTDQDYFQGKLSYLQEAREASGLPVLRKDFIIDPYQVYEARAAGADAVLLIVRALEESSLKELHALVEELELVSLVEVHSEDELVRALDIGATIVGINNRDLSTFTIHLDTTLKLRSLIPEGVTVVSESGIKTAQDIERLKAAHVDALLIGEAFMEAGNLSQAVVQFLGWMAK